MMRGQALRYLGWQIVDRTGPRVLACWFLGGVILLLIGLAMRQSANAIPAEEVTRVVTALHGQIGAVFAIILAHGIVSHDRTQGYFRFYLAKPVSAAWFYGQSAALSLAGMAAASAGFVVLASLLVRPIWPWELVGQGLALYALLGMLVVVASTLTPRDWLWAIVVLATSSILRGRFPAAESATGRVLNALLPPNHLLGETLSAAQWLWIGGWGAGLFVLALLILRLRPIGEG